MKKSLVLATAMALGVTASAYAANPFSDVPAGHWAYDSISKLAAAGVIEGYGDDTFRGDRLMTRYEMAQIVAKAMSKGANVNKLAAEFADELDALGVRVAALEKKSDNVKITGSMRFRYQHLSKAARVSEGRKNKADLRSRIWFTGKVNDNWTYTGMIENVQDLNTNTGEDRDNRFQRAYLEGRLGGVKVFAGRDNNPVGTGNIYDACYEAVRLTYGDKVYVTGAYGKLTDPNEAGVDGTKKFWQAEVGTNMDSFVNGKVGYFSTKLGTDGQTALAGKDKVNIWYVGADFNVAKDLTFNAMYLRSNAKNFSPAYTAVAPYTSKKDGYVLGLAYKGAEPSEPGSWGLSANYYHQGRGTYIAHTIDGFTDFYSGFKGWSIGGDYTVAKNMVLGLSYYDTKALESAADDAVNGSKAKVLYSELNVYF